MLNTINMRTKLTSSRLKQVVNKHKKNCVDMFKIIFDRIDRILQYKFAPNVQCKFKSHHSLA